ncbi:hypothetical protein KORDIASMS9_04394 [Kordia sp. SMS9]|nr:hypothetical protein KORDIASMS9_04394 [Kordia sp. SMS9]
MLLSLTQFVTIIIESAKLTYFTRLWSLQSQNNFNQKQLDIKKSNAAVGLSFLVCIVNV